MPKDNVNCIDEPNLRAEVTWKPDGGEGAGYVQIATVHTDNPVMIPNGAMIDGWHVTLDREQINRLIRSLRRARDSAFGADA